MTSPAATTAFPGINIAPLFGHFDYDLYGHTYYLYCLGVLFVAFYVVRRIVYSPFGQALVGIRENVARMHALGSPVHWRLVVAYTISAAVAGIAGALFAQTNTLVTLGVFDFDQSAAVLMMLILGGAGWLYGAFVGATLYMVLQNELAKLSPEFWQFGIGAILIAVVLANGTACSAGSAAVSAPSDSERSDDRSGSRNQKSAKKLWRAHVANNISFALPRGARYALIGPNGAGKTTLVNLITGRLRASAGQVLLDGDEITALSQAAPDAPRHRPHVSRSTSCFAASRSWRTSISRSASGPMPAIGCGDPPGRKPRSSTKRLTIWNRSRSSMTPISPFANCPMGGSVWSKSPSRSRSDRSSCCSTSRQPAFRPRKVI